MLASFDIAALSMVYNFRIAQITKEPLMENSYAYGYRYRLIPLVFDQYQQKYTGSIDQNFAGGLCTFIYDFWRTYYFRIDGAVSHIHQTTCGATTFSGSETDDILLTVGRDFKPYDHTRITFSGLCGVPTHSVVTLKHVNFGYGQASVGGQLDGAYIFAPQTALLCGTRYIHFVPRGAQDTHHNHYHYTAGNLADLLVGVRRRWGEHGLESGYARRWNFGRHISPSLDQITSSTSTRNSFYLVYKYHFEIGHTSNRLLVNIGYGYDSKARQFSNRHIVTAWAAWNIHF